ncbi:MAG: hypothetical protein ABSH20_03450 [Tepidisphaeraceae bacterium]|jgi:hypothetical protein
MFCLCPKPRDLRLALLAVLAGCATQSPTPSAPSHANSVPADATLIATHSGVGIFVMEQDGILYIVQADDGALIHASPVMLGHKLLFAPERNQITINGIVVHEGGLSSNRSYKFYFDKQ